MSGGQPASNPYGQSYQQPNQGQGGYQPGQGSNNPSNPTGQYQPQPNAGQNQYQPGQTTPNQYNQGYQQPNPGQSNYVQGQGPNNQNGQYNPQPNQPSGGQSSQQIPNGSNQNRGNPNPIGAADSSAQPAPNRVPASDPNRSQGNSAYGGNSNSQGGSLQQGYNNQGGANNPYNTPSVSQPTSYPAGQGGYNQQNPGPAGYYNQNPGQPGFPQQGGPPQRDPDVMIELKEAFKMLLPAGKSELSTKEIKIAIRAFGLSEIVTNPEEFAKNNLNQVQFENVFYPLVIKNMYSDAEMVRLFKILDLDGKSKINYQNLKEICKHSGENFTDDDLRDIITEADRDRDQALNYQEFVA